MTETSIPCSESTRNRLREMKGDEKWDAFLAQMADEFEGTATTSDLEARMDEIERRVSDIESMATHR